MTTTSSAGPLDTTRWSTVVRRNDQFLTVSGGALNIDAQKQDIHGGDQGLQNIVLQSLPATGPWTATARVTWNPTINYQNAGLMVYLNDGAFIKTGMVWADGRKFEAFKETNNSPAGLGNTGNLAASFPSSWYIRLVSTDGQAVQAQYSPDNVTWSNIGNATNMNNLAGAKVGMYATASTAAAATTNVAVVRLVQAHDAADGERRVRPAPGWTRAAGAASCATTRPATRSATAS